MAETEHTPPPNLKVAYFLIDESGSMDLCKQDVITGMNALVADLTSQGVEVHVFTFDTEWEEVEHPLTDSTYRPSGKTRLRDSMVDLFARVREKVEGSDGAIRPSQAWLVVQTDGRDNMSMTPCDVASTALEQFERDGYQFLLLTVGSAAAAEGRALGVSALSSLGYQAADTHEVFTSLSTRMSGSGTQGTNVGNPI